MRLILLAFLFVGLAATSAAGPLRYRIEGQVTRVDGSAESVIVVGDLVTGYLTHDPDSDQYGQRIVYYTTDADPEPGSASYPNAFPTGDRSGFGMVYLPASIEISVGGVFQFEQEAAISVGPLSTDGPVHLTGTDAEPPIQIWSLGQLQHELTGVNISSNRPAIPWVGLRFDGLDYASPRWENAETGQPLLTSSDIAPLSSASGPISGSIGFKGAQLVTGYLDQPGDVFFQIAEIYRVPSPGVLALLPLVFLAAPQRSRR